MPADQERLVRKCQCCGDPITHHPHAKTCRKAKCLDFKKIKDRKRWEDARKARRAEQGFGNCRYCGTPLSNGIGSICKAKECRDRQKVENSRRSNERRKARGLNGHYRSQQQVITEKQERIEMTCECGRAFTTKATWDHLPQYRTCLECRQSWDDLDSGAMA